MIDATLKLRAGMLTAIDAAMTAGGYTCPFFANPPHNQTLPYGVFPNVLQLPRHTKTVEGTTSFHTVVVYADDPDEAQTLSGVVLSALTNRSAPITVATVKLITYDLDSMSDATPIPVPEGQGAHYGVSLRFKYRTHE